MLRAPEKNVILRFSSQHKKICLCAKFEVYPTPSTGFFANNCIILDKYVIYFSFKFCPVFHQSALELSYFDKKLQWRCFKYELLGSTDDESPMRGENEKERTSTRLWGTDVKLGEVMWGEWVQLQCWPHSHSICQLHCFEIFLHQVMALFSRVTKILHSVDLWWVILALVGIVLPVPARS